jgi:hypothetical protein
MTHKRNIQQQHDRYFDHKQKKDGTIHLKKK